MNLSGYPFYLRVYMINAVSFVRILSKHIHLARSLRLLSSFLSSNTPRKGIRSSSSLQEVNFILGWTALMISSTVSTFIVIRYHKHRRAWVESEFSYLLYHFFAPCQWRFPPILVHAKITRWRQLLFCILCCWIRIVRYMYNASKVIWTSWWVCLQCDQCSQY